MAKEIFTNIDFLYKIVLPIVSIVSGILGIVIGGFLKMFSERFNIKWKEQRENLKEINDIIIEFENLNLFPDYIKIPALLDKINKHDLLLNTDSKLSSQLNLFCQTYRTIYLSCRALKDMDPKLEPQHTNLTDFVIEMTSFRSSLAVEIKNLLNL